MNFHVIRSLRIRIYIVVRMYIKGHVETVNTKDQTMLLCIEYGILFVKTVNTKIKARNALNAMFVETVDTTLKTHPHIPAQTFLNIQPIFNPKKVLESWGWGLFNHTINTTYVNTVDTRLGSLMHSMLSMLTLLIQNTSTHSCPKLS